VQSWLDGGSNLGLLFKDDEPSNVWNDFVTIRPELVITFQPPNTPSQLWGTAPNPGTLQLVVTAPAPVTGTRSYGRGPAHSDLTRLNFPQPRAAYCAIWHWADDHGYGTTTTNAC
jgi:hypothetical protein